MNLTTALQIRPHENIAIVGGGGKSSVMFRLGRELAAAGKRVLLTTTTRIFAAQIGQAPAHITFDPNTQTLAGIISQLQHALVENNQILLTGAIGGQRPALSLSNGSAVSGRPNGKAMGLEPQIIDKLAQTGIFDVIINEADGSRMRPFKAPAAYEPVIPGSATLVTPVIGLDALGKPLTAEYVHRPELVSALSGAPLAAPISAQTIAGVITHPAGGLKGVPPSARVVPLLNKLDLATRTEAQLLARLILQLPRVDSVAVGSIAPEKKQSGSRRPALSTSSRQALSLSNGSAACLELVKWVGGQISREREQTKPIAWVENRVAAVILAAGQSSRFGSPKQLALWRGRPFLTRVVDAALAANVSSVIVVLGANAGACKNALAGKPVETVINPAWAEGQSTSMKAGLNALPQNTSAAIFLLADQPMIKAATINQIIERYQSTLAPVVWPTVNDKRGNPVLFDRALFPEMQQISGDTGARPVLLAHKNEAQTVELNDPGILKDIDTPNDLAEGGSSVRIDN